MKSSSVQLLILELLKVEHAHLTAQEIYAELKPRLPSVNPSTVYRALERLVHDGGVSVSDMGKGAVVYEIVGANPHHHLVCQDCQKVIVLDAALVQDMLDKVAVVYDHQITTNHLVLFGRCPACRAGKQEQQAG